MKLALFIAILFIVASSSYAEQSDNMQSSKPLVIPGAKIYQLPSGEKFYQLPSGTTLEVITKARMYLEKNTYVRSILEDKKQKDLLNPENKFYTNTVSVNEELTEVRFHHSGWGYDSYSITFHVSLKDNSYLKEIKIIITPPPPG